MFTTDPHETEMYKRWISRPCVSLKYFNLILIPLAESSPGYTGKGHANPQVEMSEVYFYIVVMNFAFKAKQIMYKVWLASVPTTGKLTTPTVMQKLQSREVTENGL